MLDLAGAFICHFDRHALILRGCGYFQDIWSLWFDELFNANERLLIDFLTGGLSTDSYRTHIFQMV